jgi:hypothetical protein
MGCWLIARQTGAAVEASVRRSRADVNLTTSASAIGAGALFRDKTVDEGSNGHDRLATDKCPSCELNLPIKELKPVNTPLKPLTWKPFYGQ